MTKKDKTLSRLVIAAGLFLYLIFIISAPVLALDGEVIVSGKCTACHSTDRIKSQRKTTGEWSVLVDQEINRGAQLNSDERAAVIKYLAANFNSAPAQQAQQTTSAPAPAVPVTPKEQAYTGIELWQLVLAGSSFIGSGLYLRRKR